SYSPRSRFRSGSGPPREPGQNSRDSVVDLQLHPALIIDVAVHAALGPAAPDQLAGASIDKIEQDCARVIDGGLAVIAVTQFLINTIQIEPLINACVIVEHQLGSPRCGLLESPVGQLLIDGGLKAAQNERIGFD